MATEEAQRLYECVKGTRLTERKKKRILERSRELRGRLESRQGSPRWPRALLNDATGLLLPQPEDDPPCIAVHCRKRRVVDAPVVSACLPDGAAQRRL